MGKYAELISELKKASVEKDRATRSGSLENIANGLKGISGTGMVLSESLEKLSDFTRTLEPGDFARLSTQQVATAPIGYDLWYLWTHCNMMARYYEAEGFDGDHKDYSTYLAENLKFLARLTGLKPLKTIRDLKNQITSSDVPGADYEIFKGWPQQYTLNGIYWINTIAFELWNKDIGMQYASDGPKDFKANEYCGYLSLPIGQIGVMEVISLIQETKISGYTFTAGDSPSPTGYKIMPPAVITDDNKPKTQSEPLLFPDMKDDNGNQLAGKNYCYGKHLMESAYLVPKEATASDPDKPEAKDVPPVSRDVELLSARMEKYLEDVRPKMWMRYWIHRESTLPVPGEFVGILCRPVACAPHVWWFQESSPFLYAGNWIEMGSFTSGVITQITREDDRPAGSVGDKFWVEVQGCEIIIYATDFFEYSVGDRVAIIKTKKIDSTGQEVDNLTKKTESFTWLNQRHFKGTEKGHAINSYLIFPATYFIGV